MSAVVVVDRLEDWPATIPGVHLVDSWSYLTRPESLRLRQPRVYNLCRSYRYQTAGYYVSLLALARGHRPLPDVAVIQDLKLALLPRWLNEELEDFTQRSLAPLESSHFALSVYFGRNLARRHAALARRLYGLLPAPLLRAEFARGEPQGAGDGAGRWTLRQVRAIALADVPESHREFLFEAAAAHFQRPPRPKPARPARFSLAVLADPDERDAPSNAQALKRFEKAASKVGFEVTFIRRDDFARLAEFDALFLRETTAVNHHTYRFARRAARDGLVVIDDPDSILRCTNKVYLAELLAARQIAHPRTVLAHRGNIAEVARRLGFPLVLKLPDSAFSLGVVKVADPAELAAATDRFFKRSELLVAQAYTPTAFDWRVGVLGGEPLFVCRYYMAKQHWQIIARPDNGRVVQGNADCVPIDEAPAAVLATGLAAANAIGRGLYGVDLKESPSGEVQVIEVNDNPNIDAGLEDQVLGDALWDRLARYFMVRVERRAAGQVDG